MRFKISIDPKVSIEVDGLFMYKNKKAGEESARLFYHDYLENKYNFNACIGAYRFRLISGSEILAFDDNSGMMRSVLNFKTSTIADTLADSVEKKDRNPNYAAIMQYLTFNCTYDNSTVCEDVYFTDPDMFYIIKKGISIQCRSKNLIPLGEMKYRMNLYSLLRKIINGLSCETRYSCVVTGGTDSRMIVSALMYQGLKPNIVITGNADSDDVRIAKEISKKIACELTVIDDHKLCKDWIADSVKASNGMFGVYEIRLLNKKAEYQTENFIDVEFGGLAGEIYKNSFINQDFPIYFGKPQWKKFYKYKVKPNDFPEDILGPQMEKYNKSLEECVRNSIYKERSKNKFATYQKWGYRLLQSRFATLTTSESKYYTQYNPLLERSLVSGMLNVNPYKLEMQAYQRFHVSKYCPDIKDINTDRGISCNYSRRFRETISNYYFLLKIFAARTINRRQRHDIQSPLIEEILKSKLRTCF